MRITVLRALAACWLSSLAACNMVTTDHPMFTAADSARAPPIRTGVWRADTVGCAFDEAAPQEKWPPCAGTMPGFADPPVWLEAAGDPVLLQTPVPFPYGGRSGVSYVYYAFHPISLDAQGRAVSLKMWPVRCGPPSPDKPTPALADPAGSSDRSGSRVLAGFRGASGSLFLLTKSPLPGLTMDKDGSCTPRSVADLWNAAKASEAWADAGSSIRWVREAKTGDLPPISQALLGEGEMAPWIAGGEQAPGAWIGKGPHRLWSADCAAPASISLDVSVYRGNMELGDTNGWGLFYHPSAGTSVALYDDGYIGDISKVRDRMFAGTGPYVGWRFDGKQFSGPMPTFTYTPLPAGGGPAMTVFDLAAQLGPHESTPSEDPPFLNAFVDPTKMSADDFAKVTACMSAHRKDLNAALALLPTNVPPWDRQFFRVLALGGLVYGHPPFDDPAYMAALSQMRGSTEIPNQGTFIIYPGGTARGVINGHSVRVFPNGVNNPGIEIDGKAVDFDSDGKSNVPGVFLAGPIAGWRFDGGVCRPDMQNCGKEINLMSDNSDGSETFWAIARVCQNTWTASPGLTTCYGETNRP